MKEIKVQDMYRTNRLSQQPGGKEVTVTMRDGLRLRYDKVKNPVLYIGKLQNKEDIVQIDVDGEMVWNEKEDVKFWEQNSSTP